MLTLRFSIKVYNYGSQAPCTDLRFTIGNLYYECFWPLSRDAVPVQHMNWFPSPLRSQEAQPVPVKMMTLHCGEHFSLITALTGSDFTHTARLAII